LITLLKSLMSTVPSSFASPAILALLTAETDRITTIKKQHKSLFLMTYLFLFDD